ncbi:TIGR03067 domain-containing protein [Gemmata sp. G18]|uniref:TIGR03067 domain-containing protein n=1 Tax=Gemmata palustris TaxID=2822762 RepID=A0ABS5BXK8_9BACT|nr:TIGR03067 domain-containing protein [Gemmata palustris]MBP3958398.1 TIGR03067 domain-containing protein [Gemmata palustris]
MLAVVVLSVLAVLPDPTEKWPEAARTELKNLQGHWRVEKNISAGDEMMPPEEQIAQFKGRFLISEGGDVVEVVAIDPTTDPKCIDFRGIFPDRPNAVTEAVYKLDGDTLILHLYMGEGKSRPAGLDPQKEKGFELVVLKRVKK